MVKIYGFAADRKMIKYQLSSKCDQIILHLLKIWLYPDAEAQSHWKKEVYSFLNSVSLMKSTKKFPTKQMILDSTWGIWGDATSSFVAKMYKKPMYPDYTILKCEFSNIEKAVKDYFDWLADELSSSGMVYPNEVYDEIEDIRKEFIW